MLTLNSEYEPFSAFSRIDAEVLDNAGDLLGKHPPEYLYHYTTPKGLLGIVDTGTMFLSDSAFLNDRSEVEYARGVVASVLRSFPVEESAKGTRRALQNAIAQFSDQSTLSAKEFRFYVACFCENGDLLSQWRAYALPGSGYTLGFRTNALQNLVLDRSSMKGVELRRVLYEREDQERVIKLAIRTWKDDLPTAIASGEAPREHVLAAFGSLLLVLSALLPQFKHPVFSEEAEWRLICGIYGSSQAHRLSFRQSGSNIIPFIPLDLRQTGTESGRLPLSQISHAPSPDPELRKRTLTELLLAKGYPAGEVPVAGSSIPLRSV